VKTHILVKVKFFKNALKLTIISALTVGVIYFVALPITLAALMPDDIRLSNEEVGQHQSISPNKFVKTDYDREIGVDDNNRTWIDLKLFGLIKIKRVMVDVLPFDSVYAGGMPIGFSAKTDGVVVLRDGKGYKRGDVITNLDSATITSVKDLERHLGAKRLGIWVKDDVNGVGTLTYINPENNNFAALGHKVVDFETGASVNVRSGDIYSCNVLSVEKSDTKTVGSYQSTLAKSRGSQGSILSSNTHGVFGCLNDDGLVFKTCKKNCYPVASRYSVKPGKAKILTALNGKDIREYDIEIIKARYQKTEADKGIILRITDKELLATAGGIIHGMSGSPIIQNGHIVGALTHVIQGDVTRGFGIYIDFVMP
jgi:stage IV sporulation protein B